MHIPSLARDLTLVAVGLVATVLAAVEVLPRGVLVVSVTVVVAGAISAVLARSARRAVASFRAWVDAHHPDALQSFRVVEVADGGGESYLGGLLLLKTSGVALVLPDDDRSYSLSWHEIGTVVADPVQRPDRVLETIVVTGPDDEVLITVTTPDLVAGASIIAAWPDAVPLADDDGQQPQVTPPA